MSVGGNPYEFAQKMLRNRNRIHKTMVSGGLPGISVSCIRSPQYKHLLDSLTLPDNIDLLC